MYTLTHEIIPTITDIIDTQHAANCEKIIGAIKNIAPASNFKINRPIIDITHISCSFLASLGELKGYLPIHQSYHSQRVSVNVNFC